MQRHQQGPSDEQLRLGGQFWRLPATGGIGGFARLFLNQALPAAFLELILGELAREEAARLVAEFRDTLVHEGLV